MRERELEGKKNRISECASKIQKLIGWSKLIEAMTFVIQSDARRGDGDNAGSRERGGCV